MSSNMHANRFNSAATIEKEATKGKTPKDNTEKEALLKLLAAKSPV